LTKVGFNKHGRKNKPKKAFAMRNNDHQSGKAAITMICGRPRRESGVIAVKIGISFTPVKSGPDLLQL